MLRLRHNPIWPLLAAGLVAGGCGSGERGSGSRATDARPAATAAQPASIQPAPDSTVAPGTAPSVAPPPASDAPPGADPTLETVLAPLHDVEILTRISGPIVALDVEEGARVRAGQRLALIDDREQRATLAECEALAAREQSSWERGQRLHEEKMISDEEWIAARSGFDVAKAQRDRAAAELDRFAIRAPFSGVVAQRRVQFGQSVKEDDVLFRISNADTLRAELLLPESRLGTVRLGQPVRLVPVARGEPVAARVTRVSPLVDPASGSFRVTIDLDNRRALLPAGITARVEFEPTPAHR